jgi:sodium-dependent phosphate cotransporter
LLFLLATSFFTAAIFFSPHQSPRYSLAISLNKTFGNGKPHPLQPPLRWYFLLSKLLLLVLCLVCFLFSLELIELLFRSVKEEYALHIGNAVAHPLLGLCIGLLATATLQSSSTTTSLIVAMVAAGTLRIEQAVPLVMGANIGTTITAMLMSFTHVYNKRQFKKAFASALLHHFFNVFSVLLLLPLEYFFGILSGVATYLSHWVAPLQNSGFSLMLFTIKPLSLWFAQQLNYSTLWLSVAALALLPLSVFGFSALIKNLATGSANRLMQEKVFAHPFQTLCWGVGLTAIVRSSAATTALTVPLVGEERISLKKAAPFVLGANVGTTITAMIAAMSRHEEAVCIAFTHLLFNLLGVLIVYPWPRLRHSFVWVVKKTSEQLTMNRGRAFAYLLLLFFVLPIVALYWGLK